MTDDAHKYLEMIEGVVARLAAHSFVLKGWGVRLASALLGFAGRAQDAELARSTRRAGCPDRGRRLQPAGGMARRVRHLLGEVDRSHAVSVVDTARALSTFKAARLLGVSRPFLIARVTDTGRLPSRRVGTRRRVALADLLAYQVEPDARRRSADEVVAETKELEPS